MTRICPAWLCLTFSSATAISCDDCCFCMPSCFWKPSSCCARRRSSSSWLSSSFCVCGAGDVSRCVCVMTFMWSVTRVTMCVMMCARCQLIYELWHVSCIWDMHRCLYVSLCVSQVYIYVSLCVSWCVCGVWHVSHMYIYLHTWHMLHVSPIRARASCMCHYACVSWRVCGAWYVSLSLSWCVCGVWHVSHMYIYPYTWHI